MRSSGGRLLRIGVHNARDHTTRLHRAHIHDAAARNQAFRRIKQSLAERVSQIREGVRLGFIHSAITFPEV
jgi:hypothetical protein